MRQSITPIALLSLLAFISPAAADVKPDFSSLYPKGAQPCLNQAGNTSRCTGKDTQALNACLCGNTGNFVINTAICLGKNDPEQVEEVYETMSGACADSKTPIKVSEKDFIAAAEGKLTTTTTTTATPTPTTSKPASTASKTSTPTTLETSSKPSSASSSPTSTSTESPSNDGNKDSGGLSKGATIGIAVGAAVAGLAIIGLLACFVIRRRRKSAEEESHPMLPTPTFGAAAVPSQYPPQIPTPAGFKDDYKPAFDQSAETHPYYRNSAAYSAMTVSPELQPQFTPPPQRYSAYQPEYQQNAAAVPAWQAASNIPPQHMGAQGHYLSNVAPAPMLATVAELPSQTQAPQGQQQPVFEMDATLATPPHPQAAHAVVEMPGSQPQQPQPGLNNPQPPRQ